MPDTVENIENWIKKTAVKWGVTEEELTKRAELALRHKKELEDLCQRGAEMWHYEDYFADLQPRDDMISQAFDPEERQKQTDEEERLRKERGNAVLRAFQEKAGYKVTV